MNCHGLRQLGQTWTAMASETDTYDSRSDRLARGVL